MTYKTRSNYSSGATECSDKCRCEMCRREGKGFYSAVAEVENWSNKIQQEALKRRGARCPSLK